MKVVDLLKILSTEVEILLFWDNLEFINEYYSKDAILTQWLNHSIDYVCIMNKNKIAIYIK